MLLVSHFLIGFVVSFIGSIPVGSINLSVLQISIDKTIKECLKFIAGATLAEFVYCSIAMHFSAFILANSKVELYLRIISIPIFLVLAIGSFLTKKADTFSSEKPVSNNQYFWKGMLIGILNPLQIPFWIANAAYLKGIGWMKNGNDQLFFFIAGACLGSFILLYVIAKSSRGIHHFFLNQQSRINKLVGCIFLFMSFFQVLKACSFI